MKPIKGLVPFSVWLIAGMLVYQVYVHHFAQLSTLSFQGYGFFMVLGLALLAVLCVAGVVMKNDMMSVLGGMGLAGVALALVFVDGFSLDKLKQEYVFVVLGVYFASRGRS